MVVLVLLARVVALLFTIKQAPWRGPKSSLHAPRGLALSITESGDAIDAPSANLETFGLIRATLSNILGPPQQALRLDRSSDTMCLRGGVLLYIVLLVPLVGELLLRLESLSQSSK
ncbi:MAG: hypothetical protein JOZ19_13450 [Rubrobacter sp.]|nr:hypothetical protein [Rubrobacter sp.]